MKMMSSVAMVMMLVVAGCDKSALRWRWRRYGGPPTTQERVKEGVAGGGGEH